MLRGSIVLLFSLILLGCTTDPGPETTSLPDTVPDIQTIASPRHYYLYISHTRTTNNDSLISSVYDLDLSLYEMKLLGGDMALSTFNGPILNDVDALFDIKSPNTLWSIGNHDNTSNTNFFNATLRNKFSATTRDETTFIVLNSQDSLSSIVQEQKDFFYGVMDTVRSRNIVILSHKLIYMIGHPELDEQINDICNGKKGDCFHCHNPNNFQEDVLPKLIEARNNGHKIYWIGGDLGSKVTQFEYQEDENILYLGNGMGHNRDDNEVLLILNNEEELRYRFLPIDTVIKYQQDRDFPERFLH